MTIYITSENVHISINYVSHIPFSNVGFLRRQYGVERLWKLFWINSKSAFADSSCLSQISHGKSTDVAISPHSFFDPFNSRIPTIQSTRPPSSVAKRAADRIWSRHLGTGSNARYGIYCMRQEPERVLYVRGGSVITCEFDGNTRLFPHANASKAKAIS